MSINEGTLYIVATPIGNLRDITQRALDVLRAVDVIYAEDTRHSGRLLQHFGISVPTRSLHEHNETRRVAAIVQSLQQGETAALIADAGTPLISDPGYRLVAACHQHQVPVSPVPGPSALLAALCVSGLPTDGFVFSGFPPARQSARLEWLQHRAAETRTQIFYESKHRVVATLQSLIEVFGPERLATIARELTKSFETVRQGTLEQLFEWIQSDEMQQKGEFVIVIAGQSSVEPDQTELQRVLGVLLDELSVKQSVALATRLTGLRRRQVYETALAMQREDGQ